MKLSELNLESKYFHEVFWISEERLEELNNAMETACQEWDEEDQESVKHFLPDLIKLLVGQGQGPKTHHEFAYCMYAIGNMFGEVNARRTMNPIQMIMDDIMGRQPEE